MAEEFGNIDILGILNAKGGATASTININTRATIAIANITTATITNLTTSTISITNPVTLPDGSIGTTQLATDSSTKIATTAFVYSLIGSAGDMSYSDTRFKVISITRDMTAISGNVTYSGIGFTPKALIVIAASPAIANAWSVGLSDGALEDQNIFGYGDVAPTPHASAGSGLVGLIESASAYQTAALVSYNADGFTLSWAKTGSPSAGTGQIKVLAIR